MGLANSKAARTLGAAALAALALLAGAAGAQGALSDQPQVAVDKDGNAYFTWRRFDGTDIVKTRKRAPNGTFSAVQDLSAGGQNAGQPQVAVDRDGNAYYVWMRSNGTNDIIQARKRNANGALSAVQDLSAAGRSADEPQVAVDPQGNAYFVWVRFTGSNFVVQCRRRAANGALSAVQDLSTAAGQGTADPQLAVDEEGNAYFVWVRFNGSNFVAQFRRRAAGGTLGSVQGLSPTGGNAFAPQVTVDTQGNAYFGWTRSDGSNFIAQTRRRAAGGSLSAVQDLSDPGASASGAQLAVDPQGNASFVWERAELIQTRRRAASGTLGAVENLAGTGGSGDAKPELAVDPTGTASFVWAALDDVSDQLVRTRRRSAEGLLSPEQDLSLAGADADEQQLAVDPLGNAYFVWTRFDGTKFNIQTRRRAPDGTLTAVQNVTG